MFRTTQSHKIWLSAAMLVIVLGSALPGISFAPAAEAAPAAPLAMP